MKVIYMGTPDFAVGPLEAIIAAGHQVTLVVTQPDKQKGRGKEMQFTPVKECAIKHNIPVFQPVKIKEPEAVKTLKEYEADIFVVAAFGQLLSEEILYMPKYGSVNIHASLLPKYRGAAPIQWVIIDGETKTGVTIMQMDKGLDTGDMLMKEEVFIDKEETGETLHDKLAETGAGLIVKALEKIEAGTIERTPQNNEETCYAKMLSKSLGQINWQEDAVKIERLIRGLNSWPSAYTKYGNKTLKIWKAQVLSEESQDVIRKIKDSGMDFETIKPGTVCYVSKEEIYVKTGKNLLNIVELQLEGKKRMTVKEFLLGRQIETGTVFSA